MPTCGDTPGSSMDVLSVSLTVRQWECRWTYATEEMSDKYDQNPSRTILVVGIQALERMLFPVLVQHWQIGGFVDVTFGGWIVVDLDVAFEIGGGVFDSHLIERRGRVFAYGVNPEDERDESEDE